MAEPIGLTYKKFLTDELIPYARNSRTHTDAQVSKIAASIREFGFLNPVIVDKDQGIVAGHGRVLAAKKLGLVEVPCIEAAHLTEAQKRAYVIADNRLALDAGWDDEFLRVELDDLSSAGFDLSLTGFSLDELAALVVEETSPEGGGDTGQSTEVDIDALDDNHLLSLAFDSDTLFFVRRALLARGSTLEEGLLALIYSVGDRNDG